eukprot:s279_g26.t1
MEQVCAHVDETFIDSLIAGDDGACTFLCHDSATSALIRASGCNGAFFKVHRNHPFESTTNAAAFAKEKGVPDTSHLGRFKITGVPSAAGLHGLVELLVARKWKVDQSVFMDDTQHDTHAIFLSAGRGLDDPLSGKPVGNPDRFGSRLSMRLLVAWLVLLLLQQRHLPFHKLLDVSKRSKNMLEDWSLSWTKLMLPCRGIRLEPLLTTRGLVGVLEKPPADLETHLSDERSAEKAFWLFSGENLEFSRESLRQLPSDMQTHLEPILRLSLSSERASTVLNFLDTSLLKVQSEAKATRLRDWKKKMQNSCKARHSWLRQVSCAANYSCFANDQGQPTCNLEEQFHAVRSAWSGATELFRHGEPDHDKFFNQYGKYIDSFSVTFPSLSGELLRDEFMRVKESSPGLDDWCQTDFKLLSHCAPWTIDYLCEVLQLVERQGAWPTPVISGYTTLIPESAEPLEHPTDLRPQTVLSILFRIWARIRARQLNGHWQELFAHDGMWGGRTSRGAEPLLIDVALRQRLLALMQQDLALTSRKHLIGSPVSSSHVFLTRWGCLLLSLGLVCTCFVTVRKDLNLGTALDKPKALWGGILQGCPLAMLSMNVICNIWLRALDDQVPTCRPRSYVDDVSVTLAQDSQQKLVEASKLGYQISNDFVQSTGGQINSSKCFAFGDSV